MSAVDDIISRLPMADLAGQVGSDQATTESAVRRLVPALLGGLHANAEDPAGAASLSGAIENHSGDLVDGGVDLQQVDTQDGQQIVGNIFGGHTDQVVSTLGGSLGGGGQSGLVQKLLPILAPIVLSYLAQRMSGGAQQGQGGGLADVLGGMLGGGQHQGQGQQSGGGLGDLLGGLLGGQQSGSSGGVGDLLGGLLGGGRR